MASFQHNQNKVTPCLWFNNNADEAANYYCSLFNNSKIISKSNVMVEFELEGLRILGLNGGPQFPHTEAFSLILECTDQHELDQLWHSLIADGGSEGRCGWCKDKFGLSWQLIPSGFYRMMSEGTHIQKQKVMDALMPMNKIVLEDLEKAFKSD